MHILSIGLDIEDPEVTNDSYNSDTSFLDFDVVIIDPSTIFSQYQRDSVHPIFNGLKNISDNDSSRLVDDISRRNSEIGDLLKIGRTVIFFLPPPEKCWVFKGTTFEGKLKTKQVNELNLLSVFPVKGLSLILAKGLEIEFKGDGAFKAYFESMKDLHFYSAYMEFAIGKPFLFISNTDKAVGSYIPTESGLLLLLPSLALEAIEDDDEYEKSSELFIESLKKLMNSLKNELGDYNFPEWIHDYYLPEEKRIHESLRAIESELEGIMLKRDAIKIKIVELEKYKFLLCGQGKPLENEVARILREIGFDVEFGTGNRTDLIIKYKENVAVVEVKGISKSAAEKHSRQLEQSISEYCVANDTLDCKGILIINAYCGLPLEERTEKQVFSGYHD